jgi:hypothetical protein
VADERDDDRLRLVGVDVLSPGARGDRMSLLLPTRGNVADFGAKGVGDAIGQLRHDVVRLLMWEVAGGVPARV